MAVRYLPPRTKNASSNLTTFLRFWTRSVPAELQRRIEAQYPLSQLRSPFGNLNNRGTPYPSDSCLAPRWHPHFQSVIEPGVVELVKVMTDHHGLVTYTSCEGHHYEGTGRSDDERHVGMVARSPREFEAMLHTFEDVGAKVNDEHSDSAVEVAIMKHSVQGDERTYPAVDLYLSRKGAAAWSEYFASVDAVCDGLVTALRGVPSIARGRGSVGAPGACRSV